VAARIATATTAAAERRVCVRVGFMCRSSLSETPDPRHELVS
jgi:hypothetical protein